LKNEEKITNTCKVINGRYLINDEQNRRIVLEIELEFDEPITNKLMDVGEAI
jgi:hypothetical protein